MLYNQINPKINIENNNLQTDGICIIKNILSDQELTELLKISNKKDYKTVKTKITNNSKIKNALIQKTGKDYMFHDYIFIIQKSAIHTCHRDANGTMFNDIKNPSYTMILYLEDMDRCLGVIPKSHINNDYDINITNQVKDVLCQKGDILLFDANLIHSGIISETPDNLRIQMKISHKDDIPVLKYYTNYNKILNESNTMSKPLQHIQQNLSCMFPIVSNYTQTDVKKTTEYKTTDDIPLHQRIFSYLFYGSSSYYNLDNAFDDTKI